MNYLDCIVLPKKGLFSPDRRAFIEDSLLKRQRSGIENIMSDISCDMSIEPTNVIKEGYYSGIKVNHFGHFLLESLSRLSKLKASGHTTVIWISKGNTTNFTQWQKDIFQLLEIDKYNHIIITEPTLISNIEVNPQEYIIWDIFTQNHRDFLGVYRTDKDMTERKLWLSRENIEGGWINENLIQKVLIENGWTIFYPEKNSIFEQLEMMLTSKVIAGIEGSAFHILLFAEEVRQKIIIFSRITDKGLKTHTINNNYKLIAKTKGFEQIEITPEQYPVQGEKVKTDSIVNYHDVFNALKIGYNNDVKFNYE